MDAWGIALIDIDNDASASSYALHVGLGAEARAHTVRVTWPDGVAEELPGLTRGEHWLERGGASRAK